MPTLHLRRGDKVLGRFPPNKIKQLITNDKINLNDLIRIDGEHQWNVIRDVPNLAKLFDDESSRQTTSQKTSRSASPSAGLLGLIHSDQIKRTCSNFNADTRLTAKQGRHLKLALSSWLELFPHLEIPGPEAITLEADVRSEPLLHVLDRQLAETRTITRKTVHYKGENLEPCCVDENSCDPWSYSFPVRSDFAANQQSVFLKDSRSLVDCQDCRTKGLVTCGVCRGSKQVRCSRCSGSGQAPHTDCHGSGFLKQSYQEEQSCNCGNLQAMAAFTGTPCYCSKCGNSGVVVVTKTRRIACSCGNGKVPCSVCKTTGNVVCNNCSGRGELQCASCVGKGKLISGLLMKICRTPTWRMLGVCGSKKTLQTAQALLSTGSIQDPAGQWSNALDETFFGLPGTGDRQVVTPAWLRKHTAALAALHGVSPSIVKELCTAGISHGTIVAIVFSPLLYIASADGEIDAEETEWILDQIPKNPKTFHEAIERVLTSWADASAIPRLYFAWLSTMVHIRQLCSESVVKALLTRIAKLGEQLAGASGKTLVEKAISGTEQTAISSITRPPLQPFEDAFGFGEAISRRSDLPSSFNSLRDVLASIEPVKQERRVVRRTLTGVWDFVWSTKYRVQGISVEAGASEIHLESTPYLVRVLSGSSFILPHKSPATTAAKTLTGIAMHHIDSGEDRDAAELAISIRGMAVLDPLCHEEYRKLATYLPKEFDTYVEKIQASNASLPAKLGGSIGVVALAGFLTVVTGNIWFTVAGGVLGIGAAAAFMHLNQRL